MDRRALELRGAQSTLEVGDYSDFAALRILTSNKTFSEKCGVPPRVGDWFYVRTRKRRSGGALFAWHNQLTADGFRAHSSGYVTSIKFVSSDPGLATPLQKQGANLPVPVDVGALISSCHSAVSDRDQNEIETIFKNLPQASAVLVRDVGQANFCSLIDENGDAILHFDVGFPTSFNSKTEPQSFTVPARAESLIVLSHWDWDHFHAAFVVPELRKLKWIVPCQRLGPTATRLAMMIEKQGQMYTYRADQPSSYLFGTLAVGHGAQGDRNNTGLALLVKLANGRTVLLAGDADYAQLPPEIVNDAYHLVASHHGGKIASGSRSVPPGREGGRLVLSYGENNIYRHPHAETVQHLADAGWAMREATASQDDRSRGDRLLS